MWRAAHAAVLVTVALMASACFDGGSADPRAPADESLASDTSKQDQAKQPHKAEQPCEPATCADLNAQCGTFADGCGADLDCGTCDDGSVCDTKVGACKMRPQPTRPSANPEPMSSQPMPDTSTVPDPVTKDGDTCVPKTCRDLGAKSCGDHLDGCGGAFRCNCRAPETCGGSGVAHVCGMPAADSPTDSASASAGCADAAVKALLQLVNAQRALAGVAALTCDDTIARASAKHNDDMCTTKKFGHIVINGKTPAVRLAEAGVTFTASGENISTYPKAQAAFDAWMSSDGHRRNILAGNFRRMGAAHRLCGTTHFWTQDFTD